MVEQMLLQLEPMMKGFKPTSRICKAMMDKITADAQLKVLITEQTKKDPSKFSPSNSKRTMNQPAGSQSPSATSAPWDLMSEMDQTPETADLQ